ncbi:ASKHA domain-containing protein [Desulfoglaeba alkanexedens]|uniref:DUF4445 domain-containing protein n=1 Tax=Desulfoglaeba alkanexedens ALDC TaxID=980445 RepID=A0A4P8L4I4_9BACT|nr:ASKHA domain-containing protein [Desulfoglaeba alkanexedens]QCQ22896.1 DUF4445 domain-containing protein [Desulfoglaeba alkanexedens ALDC]
MKKDGIQWEIPREASRSRGLRPLVEAPFLRLPRPNLDDNTADLDRLERALAQRGITPLRFDPRTLGEMAGKVREGDFEVCPVVGREGDGWALIDVVPGASPGDVLGFALDCGTSRLAFYLVDLASGKRLAERSVPNPQIPFGEDILSRIVKARRRDGLEALQRCLINACNETTAALLSEQGRSPSDVYAFTVAGNTTMSHFFLGLDPANLCREPYIPVANHFPFYRAADLGLAIHPRALVYVFPNVGAYFGGDLIAGIVACGLHHREDLSMLVDVGTNAEVVLGNRDWLIACAGAAGPALEGGVVERGMMAAPGAIDWIRIDPGSLEPTYRVIGGGKPVGICGSGLIDLVAEMFMAGILTIQGKINTQLRSPRIVELPDGPAYIVAFADETADGMDLAVSEVDIGILLKSKAAMYTILNVITRKVGVSLQDVKHIFIAGTFGNHIDPAMAIRIGMLPDLPLDTYQGVGNTAGEGAAMLLLDRELLEVVEKLRTRITYIELNVNMELMNEFRGATFLPHTDPRLFPSVKIPERALGRGALREEWPRGGP